MPVLVIEQYLLLHAEFVPTISGLISGLKNVIRQLTSAEDVPIFMQSLKVHGEVSPKAYEKLKEGDNSVKNILTEEMIN